MVMTMNQQDWLDAGVLGLLFVLFSHQKVYQIMNDTLGSVLGDALQLVDDEGHPTMVGYILHAVLFVVVWNLVKDAMHK